MNAMTTMITQSKVTVVKESVDSLCRDDTDAPIMYYTFQTFKCWTLMIEAQHALIYACTHVRSCVYTRTIQKYVEQVQKSFY